MRSVMPSRRGTEKPQMSASSTPTVRPWRASATARLTVTELLPTPPLPLAMARTRVDAGTWVSPACWRAFHRALSITSLRSSGVISPHSMRTSVTPGWTPTRCLDLALDVGPQRAAADRQLDRDVDDAVGVDGDRRHHAERHDVAPSSGSMTVASTAMTSSRVGGWRRAMAPILPVATV